MIFGAVIVAVVATVAIALVAVIVAVIPSSKDIADAVFLLMFVAILLAICFLFIAFFGGFCS